jgi:GNAT superfamily N-acetyltransferase
MIQFTVQKLSVSDIPLLQFVGRASYEPYYPHVWYEGGLEFYMDHCFNTDRLTAEMSDPNLEYLIVRDDRDELVGFMKIFLVKPVPGLEIENALYLEKIYLMPNFFGRGVGQQLIRWVVEKAIAARQEVVWLNVMQTGPVEAYLKAGFDIISSTRFEFELLRVEERNGWVMMKRL